jgi:hypothetical protein
MPQQGYEEHKRRAGERQKNQAAEGRDIGGIGFVENPKRRLAASRSFRLHCETYHKPTFALKWSEDHLKVIGQIEDAVTRGGLFATAMPRGSGKTSLAEVACEWATINGYHPFSCLIGSDEGAAEGMLDSIKAELELNELLAADYPEICIPIARLEGIANRCPGQTYNGERTRIEWTSKTIVMPTIKPAGWSDRKDHQAFLRPDGSSLGSGAILKVAGITGGIRGMKHKRADGVTVRPTLVVPDDPQTDASAKSPSQCESRERILAGAVLGLAGPGKKIAGIMPCTVIRPGDVADNLLDRQKHPEWHGTRTKLVYAFPTAEKLWEAYRQLRDEDRRKGLDTRRATAFYRKHRKDMDEGSKVAWPQRKNPDELSAIQHAMNLRFDRGDRAFFSEYQNEPLPEQEARSDDLTADQVASKLNRIPRGHMPVAASRVTAFIDVQASMLWWLVAAWQDDFTGHVIDYGAFPDQRRGYYTLRDAKHTLAEAIPNAGLEGQIYGGLEKLTTHLLGREWPRDDGVAMKVERCLIDANWGSSTDTIYQFCRQSAHSTIVMPSHGRYVGASSNPMREWQRKPGDRVGLNWRLPNVAGKRSVRYAIFDSNWWKTFVHGRLAVAMGDRGCLSLWGEKPETHRMLADHLTSEFRVRTEGRGRQVDEWKLRPERPDNHLLDCLVGAAVAASIQGASLEETNTIAPKVTTSRRVSFRDLQKQRRA